MLAENVLTSASAEAAVANSDVSDSENNATPIRVQSCKAILMRNEYCTVSMGVGLSPTREEAEDSSSIRDSIENLHLSETLQRSGNSKNCVDNQHQNSRDSSSTGNAMSVSAPNLSNTNVSDSTVSLLETFAAVARRRANGNTTNSSTANSIFTRGSNNVGSLVRLALSSNFSGKIYQSNLPHMYTFTDYKFSVINFTLCITDINQMYNYVKYDFSKISKINCAKL